MTSNLRLMSPNNIFCYWSCEKRLLFFCRHWQAGVRPVAVMSEKVGVLYAFHSQLNSNPSGNRQLLGQTNVGTVSDILTVCLFSKSPVSDNLNTFLYSTTRTRSIWYIKPGPVQVKIVYSSVLYTLG